MSKEQSLYEKMGGTYVEVDGILYPNISQPEEENQFIGKYGFIWMDYMKVQYPSRYIHLKRMGQLQERASEVNEEAYALLDAMEKKYLKKHVKEAGASTMLQWELRKRIREQAEEIVISDVVHCYH